MCICKIGAGQFSPSCGMERTALLTQLPYCPSLQVGCSLQLPLFWLSAGADCGCWGHLDPTGGPVREHWLHSAPAGSSGCHTEQPHLYFLHHRWGTRRSHFDAFFSLHGVCLLSTSVEPWPGRNLLKALSFFFFFLPLSQDPARKSPPPRLSQKHQPKSVVHVDQLRVPSRDARLLLVPISCLSF